MSSSKGISSDLPKVASPQQTTRKESAAKAPAKSPPSGSKGSGSGDGVRVSQNAHEAANSAPPNFATWGAASPGLRRGQSGDDVRGLQHQLNTQGAGIKPDGEFGPKTEKALRNFQRRKGLEQDGVAGSDVQKKLDKGLTLPKNMLLSEGSQGSKVRGAQELVNRFGGDLKTDGKYGPKTQDAVKKLQKEHGLKEDGIVGPETLKLLNTKAKGPDAPSKGEPKKAEPKAAEPKKGEPGQPDPKAVEPKKGEPGQPDPKAVEPKKGEPGQPDPKAVEPKKGEPVKPDPKAVEPKKGEPGQPDPKAVEPKKDPPKAAEPKKEFSYLKENVRQALEKSGKFETLRKLPPDVISMYDKMTAKARQEAGVGMAGSTFGVSHRNAFVTGQAMGSDTFTYMADKAKTDLAAGKITAKENEAIQKAMPLLRNLSEKQRDAIADMLIMQSR